MANYQMSKYVKKVKYSENEIILFNTLNSAIVILPAEQVNQIPQMDKKDLCELEDMGFFLTEKEVDQKIKDQLNALAPKMFNVIIEMTTACNFRCKYCYQNDWEKEKTISLDTINSCLEYIKNCILLKGFKIVGVSFFGGEPLLVKEKIYYTYNKIKEVCTKYGVKLIAEVTSNGYFLNPDFLEHFDQLNFLTTLSPQKDHDYKRILVSGDPSYDVVFQNILNCKDLFDSKKYLLGIRYNVDEKNINEFGAFLQLLNFYGIHAKVTTSYTYEHSINSYYNLLTFDEYTSWNSTKAIKELIQHGFQVYHVPKASTTICDGYYPYSIKVFADGALGLCNASVDSSMIRGKIQDICNNIDNIVSIFPEKGRKNIMNKWCMSCPEKCLCGGIKFCRQHSMCEYNEINVNMFLKTYIDCIKQGAEQQFVWNR